MTGRGPTEDDQAARQEVLSFLATRYERASRLLRDQQWDSFRAFVQLWLDTYDWRTDAALEEYLALDDGQRSGRFERFQRQARSWDTTLEFPVDDDDRQARERARWRREFADQRRRAREREERNASAWEAVQGMLEAEHALRLLPAHLADAYRLLDLQPQATLAQARSRYRELARKLHPDVSGRPEDMVALNEAWEKIADFFLS